MQVLKVTASRFYNFWEIFVFNAEAQWRKDAQRDIVYFMEALAKPGRGNVLVARTAANRGQRGRCQR